MTGDNPMTSTESELPKIALCTIGKGGSSGMVDWISHHVGVGFDKIFIYNNGAVDNLSSILNESFDPFVQIIPFQVGQGENYTVKAYADCYRNNKDDFDWMAFYDPNEYLLLGYANSIKDTLKHKGYKKFDAVRINLVNFSNYVQLCRDLGFQEDGVVDEDNLEYNKKLAKSIVNCNAKGLMMGPYVPTRNGETVRQCLPNLVEVHDSKNVETYKGTEVNKVDTSFMYLSQNVLELQWYKWKKSNGY